MGEVVLHYEDQKRNYLNESSLNLAAICSEDAFHFLITARDKTPILARGVHFMRNAPFYHKPLAYLPELMLADNVLFSDFAATTIAVRGLPFRLVERSAVTPGSEMELLADTASVSKGDSVVAEHISEYNATLVTAYPQRLKEEVAQYFDNAQMWHLLTCLLRSAPAVEDGVVMDLAFSTTAFELTVIADHSVRFANSFQWHAEADVLYYVCAVVEDLGLSPDDLLIRAGGTGWTSALHHFLKLHLPQVRFEEHEQVNTARILNLLSVSQCAS